MQAATARLRTGHDDLLVEVARSAANHVCREFGPAGRQGICGHPEIEVALAEFGRATGERKYLEQAKMFLDRRGHQTLADIEWGRSYYQDDVPFRQATSLRGHAVRATYLAAGAVDIAVETADTALLDAAAAQLAHALASRTHLTGGMGSQHQDEAFGQDWALPPDRAYSETCAAVGSIMLSWRLLLATGRTDYAEVIERALFNVVAASPATDGRAFFYTNTLHQRSPGDPVLPDRIAARASSSLRAPWFEVTCCPPNVARTLASLPGYVATRDSEGVQLQQYTQCSIDTVLADGRRVQLDVDTDYPATGSVRIVTRSSALEPWTLTLRIPSWAGGARITDADGTRSASPGSYSITRSWSDGDEVRLELPTAPRWVYPDPRVDAVRGCVAVQRGPLVLCLESADLPDDQDISSITVDPDVAPVDLGWSDQPAPVARVAGAGLQIPPVGWPYAAEIPHARARPTTVPLVPYYAWANRGRGTIAYGCRSARAVTRPVDSSPEQRRGRGRTKMSRNDIPGSAATCQRPRPSPSHGSSQRFHGDAPLRRPARRPPAGRRASVIG